MNDERRNEIWALLPSDYKTYVKRWFQDVIDNNEPHEHIFESLFGHHNLTAQADEKPKEPKFKVGDKVRICCQYSNGEIWDSVMHNRIATIKDYHYTDDVMMYVFEENYRDFGEDWLELYADKSSQEKTLDVAESVETSENPQTNSQAVKNVDYAQYRLDLAKEIAVAAMSTPNTPFSTIAINAVAIANEIVKRLKETEI